MSRKYSWRVDAVRNGATLTSLTLLDDPSVDADAEAAIKMSFSGTFLADPAVDWLTDELQPVQIVDGVEYPLGMFPVGTYADDYDAAGVHSVHVEAYDRCLILDQHRTESVRFFRRGENYINVVLSLLLEAGIVLHRAVSSDAVLATDREDWPIGTPFLTIVNQLLSEINYDDIWFDSRGYAVIRPAREPSADNIDHRFGELDNLRVLQRPCSTETDAFDLPNVFVVVCQNPELDAPMVATAANDNPLSRLSVSRRGRRVVQVTQVDNVPGQAALEDYAAKLKLQAMMAGEVAAISTVNMPGHGIRDTVALMHPDISGLYQEIGWSLTLGLNQSMTHRLRRYVIV